MALENGLHLVAKINVSLELEIGVSSRETPGHDHLVVGKTPDLSGRRYVYDS